MKKFWKRATALAAVLALWVTLCPALAVTGNQQNVTADGGMSHTVILTNEGTVKICGSNQELQLGIPDKQEVKLPELVDGLDGVTAVAAGYHFSAALKYDGTVYTWGGGIQESPTEVEGLTGVVAISAGQTDLLALTYSGTVYQWTLGQTPAQVEGLRDVVAVDAGASHFLALTSNGDVYAWGSNWSGQLGNGSTEDSASPCKLELFDIVDIAAGYSHSLAIGYDGIVYAWGSNNYGQLGDGTTETSLVPIQVKTIRDAVQVAAGTDCSLALTGESKLYSWGYGEYGQLGVRGGMISQNSPKLVSTMSGAQPTQINCGVYHCMYLTEAGVLYTWGRNKNYQLGTSQNGNVETPQRITSAAAPGTFYGTDILGTASSWAEPELEALYDQGLIPPLLWGDYQNDITRAEFAHLLVSLYRDLRGTNPSSTNNQDQFSDIQDHTLREDIIRAYNLKFISGTSEHTFSPDAPLTRQEAAKMLCSFLSAVENVKVSTTMTNMSYYGDATEIADWAAPYVAYAYQHNIMKGTGTDRFSPTASLSREQSLLIMARLIEMYDWA